MSRRKIYEMTEGVTNILETWLNWYDESDYGNLIGIALANMSKFSKENSIDLTDFVFGLCHGISLIDGTHSHRDNQGFIIGGTPNKVVLTNTYRTKKE